MNMKIDPYKHEQTYLNWKTKVRNGIPALGKENSVIILRYLSDMEKGLNVSASSVKGSRSYSRLNNLRARVIFLAKNLENSHSVSILSTFSFP